MGVSRLLAIACVATLFSTSAHAAWADGDCYDGTYDPQGQCLGFPVTTRLCDVSQAAADANTQQFGQFIVDQLRQKQQCADYWTPHCKEVGGTEAVPDKSCIYNCGLLQKASIQCSGPGTCEAATPVPNPIPTLKDIMDLAMSLTCCNWVKESLKAVCDTYDQSKLDAYATALLTTPVPFKGSGDIPNMCTNAANCITPSTVRDTTNCNPLICGSASSASAPAVLITAATVLAMALVALRG
mmetsp:Transcript_19246/g.48711  ORF Transcript_19246/g.48711 Transcript_19246/m.48711 type:complete len:241 (-) Transcript_19246:397-1119(-)